MKPSLAIESEPSHRAGHHAEPVPGSGFDDDGERIATVDGEAHEAEPDTARAQGEIVARLLARVIAGAQDTQQIGERVVLLAAAFRFPFAPAKTSRQLGEWLGVSHITAAKRLADFSKHLPEIIGDSEG